MYLHCSVHSSLGQHHFFLLLPVTPVLTLIASYPLIKCYLSLQITFPFCRFASPTFLCAARTTLSVRYVQNVYPCFDSEIRFGNITAQSCARYPLNSNQSLFHRSRGRATLASNDISRLNPSTVSNFVLHRSRTKPTLDSNVFALDSHNICVPSTSHSVNYCSF